VTTPAKIAADAMSKLVFFMLPPKTFFQAVGSAEVRTKFNVRLAARILTMMHSMVPILQFQEYR
jgi:hypothetical protein